MAMKKIEPFDEKDVKLAELAKALSHPARIAIMRKLAGPNRCICGDVVNALPLAQSTVSQHLRELKNVNLIKGEIEGAKSRYCINWETFNEFAEWIQSFYKDLKDCC